jgi:hypothetical protein
LNGFDRWGAVFAQSAGPKINVHACKMDVLFLFKNGLTFPIYI